MPELPEVETVCRGLRPHIEGNVFDSVQLNRPDLRFPFPESMAEILIGSQVERIHRRAKYILIDLENSHTLISHLGMSGQMLINAKTSSQHDHVVFSLGDVSLTYRDPRRFGFMDLAETERLCENRFLKKLGVEPLSDDLSPGYLQAALMGKVGPIKNLLLNQEIIAGIGNIYACEALFESGINPEEQGRRLSLEKLSRLVPAIKGVLQRAIESGGSSLRDHVQVNGKLGYFQHSFRVYCKEGGVCTVCNAVIKRISQSGRSTFYCPECQA